MSNATMMPTSEERYDRTGKFNLRTRSFTGSSVSDCLLQAKQEMGADAIIVSKKTFKKGALFGKWGGREIVEMTFGTYLPPTHPLANPNLRYGSPEASHSNKDSRIQELEAQLANVKESIQSLTEKPKAKKPLPFVPAALEADPRESGQQALARLVAQTASPIAPNCSRRKEKTTPVIAQEEGYPALMQQLLDADVAAPLAK